MPNPELNRLPFSPKGPFIAIKRMKANGRLWEVGDEVNPKHLSVDDRRLRLLYEGKFINMKGDDAQPDEPEKDPVKEPVAGDGEFLYDPELHQIEKEGTEYWVADDEALFVRVRAPRAKELMEALEKQVILADDILAWGEED